MAKKRGSLALGVDLGGSKILAGAVDAKNQVLGRGKVVTPFAGSAEDLTAALLEACSTALAEAGATPEDVEAIGVSVPGPLDAEKGVLLRAAHLAVKDYSVPKAFGTAYPGVPVALENDVRMAAYGEAHLGAGKGVETLVAIWVGTGVGGAVIHRGRLWSGRNRNAGEVGHMYLDFRKAQPGAERGSLEDHAGKVGMSGWMRRRIEEGEKTALAKAVTRKGRLKSSELKKAFEGGDELTQRAVARSARAVGLAMANIFDVLSPDLFVLGGGVAQELGAPYIEEVTKWARAFAFTTELGDVEVAPAALGDDAGILGAGLYARLAASKRRRS